MSFFKKDQDEKAAEEKAAEEKKAADEKAYAKAKTDGLKGTSAEKLRANIEGPVSPDPAVQAPQVTHEAVTASNRVPHPKYPDGKYPDGSPLFDSEGRELDVNGRRLDVSTLDAQGHKIAPPTSEESVAATDAALPETKTVETKVTETKHAK